MNPFQYVEAASADAALQATGGARNAVFYAGGTTLVDLMKIDVLTPDVLVDINRLPLASIEVDASGVHVGATVRNSQLAWDPEVRKRYPVLSEAILSGASTQLRNMATTAGNLLQRTRCPYFREVSAACNKRAPGSGCDAIAGFNRGHAVLGTSDKCIAVSPSDMCVALAILDAVVRTRKSDGTTRRIPIDAFFLLPGDTPERETVLEHGELITHVDLPHLPFARRSHYLKVRDRASYEFALASAAVALDVDGDRIRTARVALGGIATRPWRSPEAERVLTGQAPTADVFRAAADAALASAVPQKHNAFKVELAKRTLVRALTTVLSRTA
ncbi:MAG: xanthine dehydrogenase family protein subunit M [Myxococcaceae bacterium]|nr:xanthine dehydrogenase family protein subunit M [Myxococcaceae bacterium]